MGAVTFTLDTSVENADELEGCFCVSSHALVCQHLNETPVRSGQPGVLCGTHSHVSRKALKTLQTFGLHLTKRLLSTSHFLSTELLPHEQKLIVASRLHCSFNSHSVRARCLGSVKPTAMM